MAAKQSCPEQGAQPSTFNPNFYKYTHHVQSDAFYASYAEPLSEGSSALSEVYNANAAVGRNPGVATRRQGVGRPESEVRARACEATRLRSRPERLAAYNLPPEP